MIVIKEIPQTHKLRGLEIQWGGEYSYLYLYRYYDRRKFYSQKNKPNTCYPCIIIWTKHMLLSIKFQNYITLISFLMSKSYYYKNKRPNFCCYLLKWTIIITRISENIMLRFSAFWVPIELSMYHLIRTWPTSHEFSKTRVVVDLCIKSYGPLNNKIQRLGSLSFKFWLVSPFAFVVAVIANSAIWIFGDWLFMSWIISPHWSPHNLIF